MKVKQLNLVQSQGRQAFLDRPAHLRGVETAGLHVSVKLGRENEAVRKPAATLADHRPDPLFRPAEAIGACRIEQICLAIENGMNRLAGAFLADFVAIGVRHIAKTRSTKADRGHVKPGLADGFRLHAALSPWNFTQPRRGAGWTEHSRRMRFKNAARLNRSPAIGGLSSGGPSRQPWIPEQANTDAERAAKPIAGGWSACFLRIVAIGLIGRQPWSKHCRCRRDRHESCDGANTPAETISPSNYLSVRINFMGLGSSGIYRSTTRKMPLNQRLAKRSPWTRPVW